jgi:hypothetical protein
MYKATEWQDRVEDAETGEVLQNGTPMSAGNFNNMENGISDVSIAMALAMIAAHQSAE